MPTAKTFHADKLRVVLSETRAELGRRAGRDAAKAIAEAIDEKGEARVVFAAAPSQNETLQTLCAAKNVDWTKVVALHMDEYIGLPPGSPARFSRYLREHCFGKLPFKAVHYLDPEDRGDSVEFLLSRYTTILAQGPIDVVVMGIGENGHIAFNDPHVADFRDFMSVKLVDLDDKCRQQQVNDGCFPSIEETPTQAITLTVPTLANAARQICAVPGPLKAEAVRKTVYAPVSPECPATILRTLPNATLYLDADSASLLDRK